MSDLGKKGSKGPDHLVPGKKGDHSAGTAEGTGLPRLHPKKPGGTRGGNKGAR